jgi:glyoxylase-like metal-dependent hydrolase (beta-lactamase superfamily II)
MECTVAAHENTAQIFRNRSNTFKAQTGTSGADWEQLGGLGSIRWAAPDLSFTDRLTLFWGETSINLENHPGPQPGAIWLAAPEAQVIFVGDLLTPNQPPFLATADIPAWMDALDLLSGPQYADFQIVGGRSGLVPVEAIFQQKEILSVIQDHLTRLQNQAAPVEEIEGIIPVVMEMLDVPGSHVEQYQQRLRWGLTHAYNCACQAELADGSSVE